MVPIYGQDHFEIPRQSKFTQHQTIFGAPQVPTPSAGVQAELGATHIHCQRTSSHGHECDSLLEGGRRPYPLLLQERHRVGRRTGHRTLVATICTMHVQLYLQWRPTSSGVCQQVPCCPLHRQQYKQRTQILTLNYDSRGSVIQRDHVHPCPSASQRAALSRSKLRRQARLAPETRRYLPYPSSAPAAPG